MCRRFDPGSAHQPERAAETPRFLNRGVFVAPPTASRDTPFGSSSYPFLLLTPKVLEMEIKRVGSQASSKGPADWFTGTVWIDPLFDRADPARVAGASVSFE